MHRHQPGRVSRPRHPPRRAPHRLGPGDLDGCGFTLSVGFLVFYLACVAAYLRGTPATETEFKTRYQPHLWALRWGLFCCAVSWGWALASTWQIWRSSRHPGTGRP